ncbi:MAG: hypothetical protein JWP97_753, partial [Labilithrix sp.]|nr:hypothetical protein [Labilithrix sp.]
MVLVARDGDPAAAVAAALTTAGIEEGALEPEVAVALAGLIE